MLILLLALIKFNLKMGIKLSKSLVIFMNHRVTCLSLFFEFMAKESLFLKSLMIVGEIWLNQIVFVLFFYIGNKKRTPKLLLLLCKYSLK